MTALNASQSQSGNKNTGKFPIGSSVVYPKHGVGTVVGIQKSNIHGTSVELMTIRFEKDRMTIQVPTEKMNTSGVRQVASLTEMGEALQTLITKKKTRRKLWSRRAQEYEAKINSGEITALAEVVRDLFRKVDHVNQSYSERQLYQTALERLAREVAAVQSIDEKTATEQLETMMFKQQASAENEENKDEDTQVAVA
jgi:CarD family transcriptional regulator